MVTRRLTTHVWRRYSYVVLTIRQFGQTDVTTIVANQKNFDDVGSSVRRFGPRRLWSRRFGQFDEAPKRRTKIGLGYACLATVTPVQYEAKICTRIQKFHKTTHVGQPSFHQNFHFLERFSPHVGMESRWPNTRVLRQSSYVVLTLRQFDQPT
jgi:hypothetical protein